MQGGRSAKGAAAKGAKAVALAFAKRVLAKFQNFENGHSCIADSAMRDRLFCVPPSLVESTPDAAMDAVKEAGAVAATAERITSAGLFSLKLESLLLFCRLSLVYSDLDVSLVWRYFFLDLCGLPYQFLCNLFFLCCAAHYYSVPKIICWDC